jgi:hypothetical protein
MTYTYCKKVIENTTYTTQAQKDEMQMKLDVFLLNNRINQDQYNELTALLAAKPIVA